MTTPRKITSHPQAHEQLLYFTSSSLSSDDRRMVFLSDRTGHPNIFQRDLVSGEEIQLTENEDSTLVSHIHAPRRGFGIGSMSHHSPSGNVYFVQGREIRSVRAGGGERVLAEHPEGQMTSTTHVFACGRYLCVPTVDARAFKGHGLANPTPKEISKTVDPRIQELGLSSWLRVYDTSSGKELLAEEVPGAWITHVQFSPLDSSVILYNHEMPAFDCGIRRVWIWDGRRHFPLRSEGRGRSRDDWACHEMWERDGAGIIYHGIYAKGTAYVGRVTPDGSDITEIAFPEGWTRYGHFTTGETGVLVSDGYYRLDATDDAYRCPWLCRLDVDWEKGVAEWTPLCRHDSSWDSQDSHPHPIFDHAGRHVYFTSDRDGARAVWRVEAF